MAASDLIASETESLFAANLKLFFDSIGQKPP
jgi:hypothetical protein